MAEHVGALAPDTLSRLARFEPTTYPVISLYLNLQADQHGKDNYESFVRKELAAHLRACPPHSEARASVLRDIERINTYLANERPSSANGIVIFACAGRDGFFEALPLDAPLDGHRLSVGHEPHLFPLELVLDQYPIHAVVLADSHAARIFVFGRGRTIRTDTVVGEKINHSGGSGWSQMRYQRHVEKIQAEHARELVHVLEGVVREEKVEHILLAGDEVNLPLIKNELSKELSAKVADVLKLEAHAPAHQVMKAAAEALRRYDAKTDAEVIATVLDDYRAGGLAVVGVKPTQEAVERGQVDELYLSSRAPTDDQSCTADALVAKAHQTSASVRFIEDPALLASVGGVAAALRYRLPEPPGHEPEEDRFHLR
jgi:peptide subunit release factor 1 (eRF1)